VTEKPYQPFQFPRQDHGGATKALKKIYELEHVLDFSASINPLGHPPGLQDHLLANWEQVIHYPDIDCEEFRAAVSRKFGVSMDAILAGNGSAELIDLTLRAVEPSTLILCPPDFGLYESLSSSSGCVKTIKFPRNEKNGFLPDMDKLCEAVRPGNLIIVSNPCNPSARAAPRQDLNELAKKCDNVGAVLAVDEAFADFFPECSISPDLKRYENLIIFRSMTKFYAIPGLRLGFLIANPSLVEKIKKFQIPWSVNTAAQLAGAYCLDFDGWEEKTLAYVKKNRDILYQGLSGIPGFSPIKSDTNYILTKIEPPAPSAGRVCDFLARRGLLARNCKSFGLGDRYMRLAVRTQKEIALLLQTLMDLPKSGAISKLPDGLPDILGDDAFPPFAA